MKEKINSKKVNYEKRLSISLSYGLLTSLIAVITLDANISDFLKIAIFVCMIIINVISMIQLLISYIKVNKELNIEAISEKSCKSLTIKFEVFEDLDSKVLTVVDLDKDEALNMFHDDEAEELYNKLVTVVEK